MAHPAKRSRDRCRGKSRRPVIFDAEALHFPLGRFHKAFGVAALRIRIVSGIGRFRRPVLKEPACGPGILQTAPALKSQPATYPPTPYRNSTADHSSGRLAAPLG